MVNCWWYCVKTMNACSLVTWHCASMHTRINCICSCCLKCGNRQEPIWIADNYEILKRDLSQYNTAQSLDTLSRDSEIGLMKAIWKLLPQKLCVSISVYGSSVKAPTQCTLSVAVVASASYVGGLHKCMKVNLEHHIDIAQLGLFLVHFLYISVEAHTSMSWVCPAADMRGSRSTYWLIRALIHYRLCSSSLHARVLCTHWQDSTVNYTVNMTAHQKPTVSRGECSNSPSPIFWMWRGWHALGFFCIYSL